MQEQPSCAGPAEPAATNIPAPAEASQPEALRSRAAAVRVLVTRAGAASLQRLRRVLHGFLGLPRGHTPVPTVASLLITAVVIVAAVELVPKRISDVTLSVRARTEVVELELDPDRVYTWWLPAGNFSLLTAKADAGCETLPPLGVACEYLNPTAITIKHGATIRLEAVPPAGSDKRPRFSLSITPRKVALEPGADKDADRSRFEIRNEAHEPIVTGELVTFESAPVDLWRVPLIVKHVQIGESLRESTALDNVRQPIMTEGGVRVFARGFLMSDRYQIQEEQFDPADVVQIPVKPRPNDLLLGLISLGAGDQDGFGGFDLTLHTDLTEVFVRRLGAGHQIGVSTWSIISQLPLWLALWVVLGSLIVVANYHAARLSSTSRSHT